MHNLPETLTKHPFFSTPKAEMNEKALSYKNKMDNYSSLDKAEKMSVFRELMDLGFCWPAPLRQEGFWCDPDEKDFLSFTSQAKGLIFNTNS